MSRISANAYAVILKIGIVGLILNLIFSFALNYVFRNMNIYEFSEEYVFVFALEIILNLIYLITFSVYLYRNEYKVVLILLWFESLLHIYSDFLRFNDIYGQEYLVNIASIHTIYYVLMLSQFILCIGIIYSKTKEKIFLKIYATLWIVGNVITLFLIYINARELESLMGYVFPLVVIFLIKAFQNELDRVEKSNRTSAEILDD